MIRIYWVQACYDHMLKDEESLIMNLNQIHFWGRGAEHMLGGLMLPASALGH